MKSLPEISVIIPCFNAEQYIAECLDSVLGQTFNDYEVIIIDDGSTDASLKIIQTYVAKYNHFKLIKQLNKGVVYARNKGISLAVGKYIYPLDADDVIMPKCLERLHSIITSTNNRVVGSEVLLFGKKSGLFLQPKFSKYEMYGIHENCVVSSLFYKEDFEHFGGYRTEFNGYGGDDMDYWLNYIDKNLPMYRLKEVLFMYRTKERNESVWKNYSAAEFNKRQKIKNDLLVRFHPQMRLWVILYRIINTFLPFFYRKRINKHGTLKIKILGVPVFIRQCHM
ncbi:MAG: glycosyltransferase [Alphaproteobacteria bacterium]|nr:glycosyltransferase [Alphaproteobacteria bacterium]